jgi:hypothetical protein
MRKKEVDTFYRKYFLQTLRVLNPKDLNPEYLVVITSI